MFVFSLIGLRGIGDIIIINLLIIFFVFVFLLELIVEDFIVK